MGVVGMIQVVKSWGKWGEEVAGTEMSEEQLIE